MSLIKTFLILINKNCISLPHVKCFFLCNTMTIRTNSSKYFLYKFTFFIFFKLSQKHVVEIGKKKTRLSWKHLKSCKLKNKIWNNVDLYFLQKIYKRATWTLSKSSLLMSSDVLVRYISLQSPRAIMQYQVRN